MSEGERGSVVRRMLTAGDRWEISAGLKAAWSIRAIAAEGWGAASDLARMSLCWARSVGLSVKVTAHSSVPRPSNSAPSVTIWCDCRV